MDHPSTHDYKIHLPIDDRFFLSDFREDDLADIVLQLNDLWIHKCTLTIPHPYSEQDAKEFLAKSVLQGEDPIKNANTLHFAIRNENKRLAGCLGFDGISKGHKAELGYLVGREYRGLGVATRAIGVGCKFAFEAWDLVKVSAQVFEFNRSSAKVLSKNGFQQEGVLRQHVHKNGEYYDAIQFGLLKTEFHQSQANNG